MNSDSYTLQQLLPPAHVIHAQTLPDGRVLLIRAFEVEFASILMEGAVEVSGERYSIPFKCITGSAISASTIVLLSDTTLHLASIPAPNSSSSNKTLQITKQMVFSRPTTSKKRSPTLLSVESRGRAVAVAYDDSIQLWTMDASSMNNNSVVITDTVVLNHEHLVRSDNVHYLRTLSTSAISFLPPSPLEPDQITLAVVVTAERSQQVVLVRFQHRELPGTLHIAGLLPFPSNIMPVVKIHANVADSILLFSERSCTLLRTAEVEAWRASEDTKILIEQFVFSEHCDDNASTVQICPMGTGDDDEHGGILVVTQSGDLLRLEVMESGVRARRLNSGMKQLKDCIGVFRLLQSSSGNSELYLFTRQSSNDFIGTLTDELTVVLDPLDHESCPSINSMVCQQSKVSNMYQSDVIYACCGQGEDGCVKRIQRGANVSVLSSSAEKDFCGAVGLFVGRDFIFVSFPQSTTIMRVEEEELEDVSDSQQGFITTSPTINACQHNDEYIIQVHCRGIVRRAVETGECREWIQSDSNHQITLASLLGGLALLASTDSTLYLVNVCNSDDIQLLQSIDSFRQSAVSCVRLLTDSNERLFGVIGNHQSQLQLFPLSASFSDTTSNNMLNVVSISLPNTSIPNQIEYDNLNPNVIFVGARDGKLYQLLLISSSSSSSSITIKQVIEVGVMPVKLLSIDNGRLLAISDSSILLETNTTKALISQEQQIEYVCSINNSETLLSISKEGYLQVLQLSHREFAVHSLPVRETPEMIISLSSHLLAILTVTNNTNNIDCSIMTMECNRTCLLNKIVALKEKISLISAIRESNLIAAAIISDNSYYLTVYDYSASNKSALGRLECPEEITAICQLNTSNNSSHERYLAVSYGSTVCIVSLTLPLPPAAAVRMEFKSQTVCRWPVTSLSAGNDDDSDNSSSSSDILVVGSLREGVAFYSIQKNHKLTFISCDRYSSNNVTCKLLDSRTALAVDSLHSLYLTSSADLNAIHHCSGEIFRRQLGNHVTGITKSKRQIYLSFIDGSLWTLKRETKIV